MAEIVETGSIQIQKAETKKIMFSKLERDFWTV